MRRPLLATIMSLMGVPYAFNGVDTTGFDCSGFTATVFATALKRTLPHSSQAQYALGTPVKRDSLRFGDLVFFADGGDEPSHVGIYVGDGLFAHASVSLGVTISLLESNYYNRRYLGARRLER
jgi:cell wall-associated NlpC family hydrolase